MKLNLGCGLDYREGYVNIDCDPNVKTDWCGNACNMPSTWVTAEDNIVVPTSVDWTDTFDEIYANHTLEHFPDLFQIVDEMARVSKDGAIWYVNVPYWSWPRNQGNPHHKIHFSEDTFRFFDQGPNGIHKRRQQNYSIKTIDAEVIYGHPLTPFFAHGHEQPRQPMEIKFKLRCHK